MSEEQLDEMLKALGDVEKAVRDVRLTLRFIYIFEVIAIVAFIEIMIGSK